MALKTLILFIGVHAALAEDIDDSQNFIFGSPKSTTTHSPRSTTINPRIAAWNARIRNETAITNGTSGLRTRALFDIPLGAPGSMNSLETNFLSIQTGNTKLQSGIIPPAFVPVGQVIPGTAGVSDPSCRCEAYADCRDVSAFARSDRQRVDPCPSGRVLCCTNANRPSNPVVIPPPVPLVIPSVTPAGPGPVVPAGGLVSPPRNQGCGIKGGNPLARVFDAANPRNEAEFGEYPWMAAILKTDLNYVCGGALIDARIVLSAAHCVAKVKNEDLIVRLGEYDVSETTEPPYQDIHVKRVIIHADYHSGTLRNDIALLILDQPAAMTSYIRPVCLPPIVDFTGMMCTVTGWGKNNPTGQYSNVLKEVDVPIMTNDQCQGILRTSQELGPIFNLHNSFLCAGTLGKDACAGDGGSPLVCKVDGVYRLAGLVSWGINCGQFPGVYTRISNFVPWIMNALQEN
ncbi:phenoloxidase-activating factor 2-like [Paramacrobiotus metropolitanus]|uniref:phenoloxidase-activating factor 2-like n=1 Tax=Paramacrobiotus metropolitanus TaxID=2943436 RepID=UPI002445AB93|nr:phenoloxidase-activating factor 2-like [Paramacrobiotus metropolitanus]